MKKNKWWDVIGYDGYMKIYESHKIDLADLYGEFTEYKSFDQIIKMEYERWNTTDDASQVKLKNLLKKKKTLEIDDWILAMTSWGIPADSIAQISNQAVPLNLYYTIAQNQEKMVKAAEQVLYNTEHLPETENLYYDNHLLYKFEAEIVEVFQNIMQKNAKNIVILDRSAFYPTSGGQQHDMGYLEILGEKYNISNVEKVGKCVLHILDRPLTQENSELIGKKISGDIEPARREQLRNNHTGTHIVFAACRRVLGPHVWQNGSKVNLNQASLDITHFSSVTHDQQMEIQNMANRIIMEGKSINKSLVDKAEAELKYGFSLYQGGIVPGNVLRVVNIDETDVEACCGTHCDSTSEVGWIKILTTKRVADGIVRLYYVAGEKSLES